MPTIKLKLQVLCDGAIAFGPGKAALLDHIATTGSIAGAARQMGMSYRRAWQLVDTMNRCWIGTVVETSPGRTSGGARLTTLGVTILAKYRELQLGLESYAANSGWHDLSEFILETPQVQKKGDEKR